MFLDIDMPVVSGFDIADNINQDSETFIAKQFSLKKLLSYQYELNAKM